ncbi:hypothetical protein CCAN12_520025 [Capnocytophaga canimorsus]|uniref:Uncharacterized protein n=1 Tax=Capnocytophaga canimorsus TaxID=28188 RepID=A0A0B7H3W9_9FLAO|nr:hypothetical protein CCAN12_520025 [Capnocytophaga canimorsus]
MKTAFRKNSKKLNIGTPQPMVRNKIRKKRIILSKILINQMIYRHKYTFFPYRKNYFVIFANETIKHTMLEQDKNPKNLRKKWCWWGNHQPNARRRKIKRILR